MADDDGQRRAEEGFKELRVEVYYGKDPVERIEDTSYDLEELVEVFPGFADNNYVLLGERIVEDFDKFEEIEAVDEPLDVAELIRDVVALAVVH